MVKKRKQTAQVDSDDSSMEVDAKLGRLKINLFGKDKDKRIQILKLKNAEYQRAYQQRMKDNPAQHSKQRAARKAREHERNIRRYGDWDALVCSQQKAFDHLNDCSDKFGRTSAQILGSQNEWNSLVRSNDLPDLAAVVTQVKLLLKDSKNNFFELAELVCKHSAPDDAIRQLWDELDYAYDENKTNLMIDKFVSRAKGAGSYKCKIAAGNVKAVRDLVNAQKNVKSAFKDAKARLAFLKRAGRKTLPDKMEGLKEYYNRQLNAQYDCEVENAESNFL